MSAQDMTSVDERFPPSEEPGQADNETTAPQSEKQEQVSEKAPVNLFEIPEYREIQARQAQRERELVERISAMQQRIAELEERDLDDEGKLRLQLQRMQAQLQAYQAREAELQRKSELELEKMRDLEQLHDVFGTPIEKMLKFKSYDEALRFAKKDYENRLAQETSEQETRRETNRVDVGRGRSSSARSKADAELERALEARDSTELMRLMRK